MLRCFLDFFRLLIYLNPSNEKSAGLSKTSPLGTPLSRGLGAFSFRKFHHQTIFFHRGAATILSIVPSWFFIFRLFGGLLRQISAANPYRVILFSSFWSIDSAYCGFVS